jgi:poly(3-hydroxybutyrate) depolymerase
LSWPSWRRKQTNDAAVIHGIVETLTRRFTDHPVRLVLTGHSGGGSFTFGFLNALERLPDDLERIAFLDSNYAYDSARGHADKLARWLKASDKHFLTVLAYDDANALLDGKPFVSATGGTWGRSHLMRTNLAAHFEFTHAEVEGFQNAFALERRVQFLLKENPARKVFHTVQVERNGFIHAMLAGTPLESRGYEYFGPRAYEAWIEE